MAINRVDLLVTAPLVLLPIILLYVLSLAIAFFLAAANVKFRDVGHIWEIIIQAAFYATPILYPISLILAIDKTIGSLLMLNPVAQAIQDSRYLLITHQTTTTSQIYSEWYIIAIPYALTAVIIVLATLYFRKSSKNFAENV